MSDLYAKKRMSQESERRVRQFLFGDPVTNICAGDGNPYRHLYFVRLTKRSGRMNPGLWVQCTDRNGFFVDICADVMFPGHIESDECARLFRPAWEVIFGRKYPQGDGSET